jgi:hypothetical protein
MKGTLDVVSFSTCMRQPDKHDFRYKLSRFVDRDFEPGKGENGGGVFDL